MKKMSKKITKSTLGLFSLSILLSFPLLSTISDNDKKTNTETYTEIEAATDDDIHVLYGPGVIDDESGSPTFMTWDEENNLFLNGDNSDGSTGTGTGAKTEIYNHETGWKYGTTINTNNLAWEMVDGEKTPISTNGIGETNGGLKMGIIFGGDSAIEYSGALMNDGTLYLWGSNRYGQLGKGDVLGEPQYSNAGVGNPIKIFDGSLDKETGLPRGFLFHSNTNIEDSITNEQDQRDVDGDGDYESVHGKIERIDLYGNYKPTVTMSDGTQYYWGKDINPYPTLVPNQSINVSKTSMKITNISDESAILNFNFNPIETDFKKIDITLQGGTGSFSSDEGATYEFRESGGDGYYIGYNAATNSFQYMIQGLETDTLYNIYNVTLYGNDGSKKETYDIVLEAFRTTKVLPDIENFLITNPDPGSGDLPKLSFNITNNNEFDYFKVFKESKVRLKHENKDFTLLLTTPVDDSSATGYYEYEIIGAQSNVHYNNGLKLTLSTNDDDIVFYEDTTQEVYIKDVLPENVFEISDLENNTDVINEEYIKFTINHTDDQPFSGISTLKIENVLNSSDNIFLDNDPNTPINIDPNISTLSTKNNVNDSVLLSDYYTETNLSPNETNVELQYGKMINDGVLSSNNTSYKIHEFYYDNNSIENKEGNFTSAIEFQTPYHGLDYLNAEIGNEKINYYDMSFSITLPNEDFWHDATPNDISVTVTKVSDDSNITNLPLENVGLKWIQEIKSNGEVVTTYTITGLEDNTKYNVEINYIDLSTAINYQLKKYSNISTLEWRPNLLPLYIVLVLIFIFVIIGIILFIKIWSKNKELQKIQNVMDGWEKIEEVSSFDDKNQKTASIDSYEELENNIEEKSSKTKKQKNKELDDLNSLAE